MLTKNVLALLVCAPLLSSPDLFAQAPGGDAILASVSYFLTDEEVVEKTKEAMDGSKEAALSLTNFYWMRGQPDKANTLRWALVGSENGSAEAQFRAYQRLRSTSNPLDHRRSIFWLRKSASQGFLDAVRALERCGHLVKNDPNSRLPCFGPEADQ
jgi:TPR repeat protein